VRFVFVIGLETRVVDVFQIALGDVSDAIDRVDSEILVSSLTAAFSLTLGH
jgi:hypothetical protein